MATQLLIRVWAAGLAVSLLPSLMAERTLGAELDSGEPVDFSVHIRPILSGKCFQCHGPDESSRKGKLRLDLREEALKDRDGSRAIVPRDLKASQLVERIHATDPDDVMPPPKMGKPLSEDEIQLLERWIVQGAEYTTHWSFVKPQRPPLPDVQNISWPRNSIDRFVLSHLERRKLQPSPPADRHALIRRITLDLTGLPPTPAETDAFVADTHPDAYERLVDRLLSSPAFGERWARVWLDLARYADSAGYGSDPLRTNIWPWRDWLISALNRNMTFDQFTTEMIAGDLLPNPSPEQLIATAFHRNTMTNTEGGTDDEEWRIAAVKDRANTTAQVWMGLTLGCAQCHTHKFDPISQREYYQFFAFFNQTEDNDQPDERPTLPLPTPEQREKMDRLKSQISRLEEEHKKVTPDFERELADWEKAQAQPTVWTPLDAVESRSTAGSTLLVRDDKSIQATGLAPAIDNYIVKYQSSVTNITAIRLEAMPDESFPKQGPGRAAETGKAMLTELQLAVRPAQVEPPRARFVRIELPGVHRILSLAEVQVRCHNDNWALSGAATQSSTVELAAARLAIDGSTEGAFRSGSITMTEPQDNPWWELDLGEERPIDEIIIWNRTDQGLGTRLADFKVVAFDAERKNVWEKTVGPAPAPVVYLRLPKETTPKLVNASANWSEKENPVAKAIDGSSDSKNGWSIGDKPGQLYAASFELENPITEADPFLILTLTQKFGTNHTIGRFRVSVTSQKAPVRELPEAIRSILAVAPGERSVEQKAELADYFREFAPSLAGLKADLKKFRKELEEIKPVALPVMRDLASDKNRDNRLLNKGNFLDPGEKVSPGVLTSFHPAATNVPPNRLALAQWLVNRDNPLTARVAVNRLWARMFDLALVETEEDFGTQGALPTHRELLDWLAIEFMDLGWDTKAMLKMIAMSATYQQTSRVTPELLQQDPRNELYSRGPRRRLDAEMVRDQALALSGLLSRKIGGPSVYPPQPDGLWRAAFNGERTWPTSKGEDRYRRGIYTFWRRTVPYPSMATFDAPSREICTVRRLPTNTPLQAFVTMNDPAFVEMSQSLARRLMMEGGATPSERARFGLALCLVRPPTQEQVRALTELFERELEHYQSRPEDALKLATEPLGPLPSGLSPAEAAAWTSVANVLLNLDGVLTQG